MQSRQQGLGTTFLLPVISGVNPDEPKTAEVEITTLSPPWSAIMWSQMVTGGHVGHGLDHFNDVVLVDIHVSITVV